jgi:hypothetical protein
VRKRFRTFIDEQAGSGSGIFDAEKRCLLGILSRATEKFVYRKQGGGFVALPNGRAGYFVPASEITRFIPAEFRF